MADSLDYDSAIAALPNVRGIASLSTGDADPEKAAQALQLSKTTGVPAPVIHIDTDRFAAKLKAQAAGDLAANNPHLGAYVASDPMAAKVSSDDYAQLDTVSQATSKLAEPGIFDQIGKALRGAREVYVDEPLKGFAEGYDVKQQAEDFQKFWNYSDSVSWRALRPTLGLVAGIADTASRTFQGVVQGATAGIGAAYDKLGLQGPLEQLTGRPMTRAGLVSDVTTGLQVAFPPEVGPREALHAAAPFYKQMKAAADAAEKAKPYLAEGKPIPVGLDPILDQIKKEESTSDLDRLKEAFKEAQKSKTLGRSQDMFRNFITLRMGEDTIGVSADVVQKLYGDKLPAPDDGILGFVPDMADQLRRGVSTGGDVQVPIADILAKMDPEVFKQIEEGIRVRPDGFTKAEEVPEANKKAPSPDEMEAWQEKRRKVLNEDPQILALDDRLKEMQKAQLEAQDKLTKAIQEGKEAGRDPENNWLVQQLQSEVRQHVDDIQTLTEENRQLGKRLADEASGPRPQARPIETIQPEPPDPQHTAAQGIRQAAGLDLDPNLEWVREGSLPINLGNYVKNARNPEWLAARGMDESSLPSWYHDVNNTLQDLAAKIGLKTKPVLWAADVRKGQEGLGGVTSNNGAHIVINSSLAQRAALHTTIHELGHQVEFQQLSDAPAETQRAITAAWRADSGKGKSVVQTRPVTGQRYDPFLQTRPADSYHTNFSEWFAEQVSRWITQKVEPTGIVEKFFKGIADIWQKIYESVTGHVALSKEVDAFMRKNWHGDLIQGAMGGGAGSPPPSEPPKGEPPTPEPGKSPPVQLAKDAKALDLRRASLDKYLELIKKRQNEDTEEALTRARAAEEQTQTAEWKKNAATMQDEVGTEVASQGRFIADKAIREGAKLDTGLLTDEQKAALPAEYHTRGGENPDSLARALGYTSGDEMIADLSALLRERETLGLSPGDYLAKVISDETDRRMEAKHGKLQENIIERAKDQVLSGTQLDALYAGLEHALSQIDPDNPNPRLPFSLADVKQAAANMVMDTTLRDISSDKLLAQAGRSMREVERLLLADEPIQAFQERQRHFLNILMAKTSREVEKAEAGFDKITKRYQALADSPKLKSRDPAYVDAMQILLRNLGEKTKRTLSNAERGMVKNGYIDFANFIAGKAAEGRDLFLPDFLKDPNFNRGIQDLKGHEFLDLAGFVKQLDIDAKNENLVWKQGEKVDKQELIARMIEKLKELGPPKKFNPNPAERQTAGQFTSATLWRHINTESMTNRIDKGDWFGDFNQTIFRPAIEGANYIDRLAKEYNTKFKEAMQGIGGISKGITNGLWKDKFGGELDLNRGHLLAILQNVGNVGNRAKLFAGYGIDEATGMHWLWHRLAKEPGGIKAALDRAGKFAKIFDELLDKADNMSRNENNGRGIDKITLGEMDTPVGKVKEWYHPLDEDDLDSQYGIRRDREAILKKGYYRATTPPGGMWKARTEATYTVPLGLDLIPTRMSQMIHDIAMRPAINNLSKIVFDKGLADAIAHYYSPHALSELKEWVNYIANRHNYDSTYEAWAGRVSNYFRSNMISTLVGANPGTVAKHGITAAIKSFATMPIGFSKEFATIFGKDAISGERNISMAMGKSEELQRRFQNFWDMINRRGASVDNYRGGPLSIPRAGSYLRSMSQYVGSYPIGFFDMASSVPLWLATYKKAALDGMSEGDSVSLADRSVRQTHGSSVFANKSGIARSSGLASWWATLYTFFSENFQKQYETAWRVKDAIGAGRAGDTPTAARNAKVALGLFFTASVLPSTVDMLIAETGDKKESWLHTGLDLIVGSVGSGFLPVKDLLWSLAHGRDPEGGLLTQVMKEISDPIRDIASGKILTPQKRGDFIKHFSGMMGLLTGIGNQSIGNVGKFAWDKYHGLEHPQGPWQEMVGARYGKTKGHTRSFDDWLKSEIPR